MTAVREFLVRGLLFARLGRHLPATVPTSVERVLASPQLLALKWEQVTGAGRPSFVQGSVFRCLHSELSPIPSCSVWVMQFFERTLVWRATNPAAIATFEEEHRVLE